MTHSRDRTGKRRVLLVDTQADQIVNFREVLLKTIVSRGHKAFAAADCGTPAEVEELSRWGIEFVPVRISRTGTNPVGEILTLWRLFRLLRRLKPDVVLMCTVKPTIYGILAARLAGIPHRFAMLTGLGYALTEGEGWKRKVVRMLVLSLLKLSLRFTDRLIVQNPDDQDFFLDHGFIEDKQRIGCVNGSGVDLDKFAAKPLPSSGDGLVFLMITRLIRDKGVAEYVEAARLVKARHPNCRCLLVGPLDPNPSAFSPSEVEEWVKRRDIEYLGAVPDVRPYIEACHVFVLPSYYREGTPRTILEALATGRPVITTNMPGCRQTVVDGLNGHLIPPRDANALAAAIESYFVEPGLLDEHAGRSRTFVEDKFDARLVSRDMMVLMRL